MKINDMIDKWNIKLGEKDGQTVIVARGKVTERQAAELKAKKPQIIEELQRREAEQAARKAKREAERAAARQAIINGEKNIEIVYFEGEYLSGWSPVNQSNEIMQELGLVRFVSGWGDYIEPKIIEALGGSEFTYQQALELSNKIKAEKEARESEKEAARQAKFDEASKTGKPVLLEKWSTDCCDPRESCNCDNHYEYAMPDGSVKHEWSHTW